MKTVLAGISIGVSLCVFAFWALLLGSWVYGAYLAFSASLLLGILALLLEPSYLIFGLVAILANVNLPMQLVEWLTRHGG